MAYFQGFKCDICGALRQPSNGWFIGIIRQSYFDICAFEEDQAKSSLATLLCGEVCVHKFVSANLPNLHKEGV